jgi:hypothetical protein
MIMEEKLTAQIRERAAKEVNRAVNELLADEEDTVVSNETDLPENME